MADTDGHIHEEMLDSIEDDDSVSDLKVRGADLDTTGLRVDSNRNL